MPRTRIGVGIWGLGEHACRNLIPALGASDRVDVVAVHTRSDDVLSETAELTAAIPYRDVDDLLAAKNVDVIVVAAPTGVHARMAIAAIDAGKHVWCEKPMATNLEDTRRVVSAAMDAGVVALESDMFLHHPQFVELRRLVESGELGSMVSLTARFGFPHRPAADFRYRRDLGGGAILDAAFYTVAAAVGLLGPGLQTLGASIVQDEDMEVDIGGTALLASGDRTALLDWGFGRAYRSEIQMWFENGIVETSRAFAKPADLETRILIRPQAGEERVLTIDPINHFALMFDSFAEITVGDVPFDPIHILERARLLNDIRESGVSLLRVG